MDKPPETLPLSKQKEFKSIKNMIISEADKFEKGEISLNELINVNHTELNMNEYHEPSIALFTTRLFHHMGRIFEDNMPLNKSGIGFKIDSKLLKKLKKKKIASGHKRDEQNLQINI